MSVRLIFVSSVFAVIFGSGGNCVAAEPSYAPWAIISSGFNGAPHSIGYAPPTGGAGPGTVFAGGDLGGAYRSKTCGETWEHVNGGPPVSDGVNSGYSTAALISPCACNPANTSCADDPLCHHGVIYGGPPSVEPGSVDVRAFEAGPMPAVFAMLTAIAGLPAGPVVYRVGSRVWFALDGGLQWYPVPPTCIQGGNVLSHFEALGVDQDPGHAGHLVAASASGGAAFEASGCKGTNYQCATRQIAWTDDASFQMQASIDASDQSKSGAEYQIDRNSTWHFASLAHLATSNQPDNPSSCPAVPDVNLPGGACPVNNKLLCHGIKPTVADTAREDACLDLSTTNSKCFCADNPGCRYPAPTSVEIDPRNGWAYATTESGLLLSVDRGRSWGRNGLGNDPVPALRAEAAFDGLVHKQDGSTPQPPGDYPLPPSPVRLLTGMTSSQDADVPPAAWINDGNDVALDLNFAPWRIAHMGKMSLVFKALPGSPTNSLGRVRGTVTAYVPVDWQVKISGQGWVHHSSVFMARSEDDGNVPGPLLFRDVNTLQATTQCADIGLGNPYCVRQDRVAPTGLDLPQPKLPGVLPFGAWACLSEDPHKRARLLTTAVAAAPSDPRIAYATLWGTASDDSPCPPNIDLAFADLNGLYQTLDGGLTWHLVVGTKAGEAVGQFGSVNKLEGIRVDSTNPYRVWATVDANGTAYRIMPINATTANGMPDTAVTDSCGGAASSLPLPTCSTTQGTTDPCGNKNDPAGVWALPECHYPSDVHPVRGKCEDCAGVGGALCGPDFEYLAPGCNAGESCCDASGDCGQHPRRCCLGVQDMVSQIGSAGGVQSRGWSEEGIFSLADFVGPPPEGGGVQPERLLYGTDDLGTNLTAPLSTDGGAVSFGPLAWVAADGLATHPSTGTTTDPKVESNPDSLYDIASFDTAIGGPIDFWALTTNNGRNAETGHNNLTGLYHVTDVGGTITARRLGNVTEPVVPTGADIAPGIDQAMFTVVRRGNAHIRLKAGPTPWLFASIPPFGVYAIDTTVVDAHSTVADSDGVLAPPGAIALNSWPNGPPIAFDQLGPDVEDIAYDGAGWLWAAVASCGGAGTNCASSASIPPGIYRHRVGSNDPYTGEDWTTAAWDRVPQPPLNDPYVLRVATLSVANRFVRTLLVGNWSRDITALGADCNGGLYALPLTGPSPGPYADCPRPGLAGYFRTHARSGNPYVPGWQNHCGGLFWPACPTEETPGGCAAWVHCDCGDDATKPCATMADLEACPPQTVAPNCLYNWTISTFAKTDDNNCIAAAPSTQPPSDWHMLLRHDGISAIDFAGDAVTALYVGVTHFLPPASDLRQDNPAYAVPNTGFPYAVDVPANRPGVYRIDVTGLGVPVQNQTAGQSGGVVQAGSMMGTNQLISDCTALRTTLQGSAGNLLVADCTARNPKNCAPLGNATASPDHLIATDSMVKDGGLVKANLAISTILASKIDGDEKVMVGTYGGGAFRFVQMTLTSPIHGHAIKQVSADPNTGNLVVHRDGSQPPDWLTRFAELNLRYSYPTSDHDFAGAVLLNGQALPCPYGNADHCLPTSGLAGASRVHTFWLPPNMRNTNRLELGLAPATATAVEAKEASLIVDSADLIATWPVVGTGSAQQTVAPASVAGAGRLHVRVSGGATLGNLLFVLNDHPFRVHGEFEADGVQAVTLPALGLQAGTNTLRATTLAGAPVEVEWMDFAVAAGAKGMSIDSDLQPIASKATHYVSHPAMIQRRSTSWLEIELIDPNEITTIALDDNPPQVVQAGFAMGAGAYRIPLDETKVIGDSSSLHFATGSCSDIHAPHPCQIGANVSRVAMVSDIDDNPDHCMPSPELCNDNRDNDCNGLTDDQDTLTLCDGPDPDGCALGHPTCGASPVCLESLPAPTLAGAPTSLNLTITRADVLLGDGTVTHPTVPPSFDILGALHNGLAINDVSPWLPDTGAGPWQLTSLTLHVSAATAPWNGSDQPIALRSSPADLATDQKLTLVLANPTTLYRTTHLNLRIADPAPPSFYGCPGGEITFPSQILVADAPATPQALPCGLGPLPPAPTCQQMTCGQTTLVPFTQQPQALAGTVLWTDVQFADGGQLTLCAQQQVTDLMGALGNGLDYPDATTWISPAAPMSRTVRRIVLHLLEPLTLGGMTPQPVLACGAPDADGRTLVLDFGMGTDLAVAGALTVKPSLLMPPGPLYECAGTTLVMNASISVSNMYDTSGQPPQQFIPPVFDTSAPPPPDADVVADTYFAPPMADVGPPAPVDIYMPPPPDTGPPPPPAPIVPGPPSNTPPQVPVCAPDPQVTVPAMAMLTLSVTSADLVFGDSSTFTIPFPGGMPMEVLMSVQANDLKLDMLETIVSPTGRQDLQQLVFHLAGPAMAAMNTPAVPLTSSWLPTDTVTLDLAGGTQLGQGHHLLLVPDPLATGAPLGTFYECQGGFGFPAVLHLRNACDSNGSNICGEVEGPLLGNRCDGSNMDGCRQGWWLPLGAAGALACVADDPGAALQSLSLSITVAQARFEFDCTADTRAVVPGSATTFDLFAMLAGGTVPTELFTVPDLPTCSTGQLPKLTGIRLSVVEDSNGKPLAQSMIWGALRSVVPRAGNGGADNEILLQLPWGGVDLAPTSVVALVHNPPGMGTWWQMAYQCQDAAQTVTVPATIAVTVMPQAP